ncbi:M4 family metallopeptidase [Panacibacter sp. DH6]|uniref:M4 family metallopeptidase n=1 Tax=Panacibacter microcysteis TaxID=2793269 RepID=A0A931E4R1_9BACT|nr:M4 family metallopeptidase [Panacibacter microcysteis]MBG9374963.1 M4 family metallopeptidase [Panacibacter microcysteis]
MKNNTIDMYCFRLIAMVSLLLVIDMTVNAQTDISEQDFWNDTLRSIALPTSNERWIDLREDAAINGPGFFRKYGSALRLTAADEMRQFKIDKDALGNLHLRFNQYHKNIRVANAEYIVHINKKGLAYVANGRYVRSMNKNISYKLNKTQALDKALGRIKATRYRWQDKYWEKEIKERTKNPDTSYYPKGELIWTKDLSNDNSQSSNFRLAYQFDIFASAPRISRHLEIDASTGEVINDIPLELNCNPTTVNTIWNGNRSISTQLYNFLNYRLLDDCDATNYWVRDFNFNFIDETYSPLEILSSNNNTWASNNNQVFGASVLWALRSSGNYFKNSFGRNGWNNNNGQVNGYVNAYFLCSDIFGNVFICSDNASFNPSTGEMFVGLGSTGTLANSYGTLDIIGHEFTHGVTGTSTGLVYAGESGAINESLSDIFGTVIESITLSTNNDYLMGEDRTSGAIRSLSNPNQYSQPDTYQGNFWYTGALDNGGVHTNSGVMNYWFYLISNGGSGTNDIGNAFTVATISQNEAAFITYQSYYFMTSTTNYMDMRNATLTSAKTYYGNCSYEAYQVANAWYAVGVGTKPVTLGDGGVCGIWPVGNIINYAVTGKVVSPPVGCASNSTAIDGTVPTSFTGTELTFLPGFYTKEGANFLAYVTSCNIALPPPGLQPVYADNTSTAITANVLQKKSGQGFSAIVYPNPASTHATVQLSGTKGNVSAIITNVQGTILWRSDRGNNNIISIGLSSFPAGTYFIKIKDNEHTKVLKLLKE